MTRARNLASASAYFLEKNRGRAVILFAALTILVLLNSAHAMVDALVGLIGFLAEFASQVSFAVVFSGAAVAVPDLQLHFSHRPLDLQQRRPVGLVEDAPAHRQEVLQLALAAKFLRRVTRPGDEGGIHLQEGAVPDRGARDGGGCACCSRKFRPLGVRSTFTTGASA